jgi:hypothetical protein
LDHSIKDLVASLAPDLLIATSAYEPYVPDSNQNLYHGLELLSQLGSLTTQSLPAPAPAPSRLYLPKDLSPPPALLPDAPALPVPQPSSQTGIQKESAEIRETKKEPPVTPPPADAVLLQALQALRDSKRFHRKTPGIFSPILKDPNPKPPSSSSSS